MEAFFDDLEGVTPTGLAGYTQAYNFANRYFYYKTSEASGAQNPTLSRGRLRKITSSRARRSSKQTEYAGPQSSDANGCWQ